MLLLAFLVSRDIACLRRPDESCLQSGVVFSRFVLLSLALTFRHQILEKRAQLEIHNSVIYIRNM